MSERFPASILSPTPVVPSVSSAPGIWTMEQQLQAQAQTLWPLNPGAVDPNFKNVSLLLHGDGTNGAQNNTFLHTPPTGVGSYAGYFPNSSSSYASIPNTTSLDFGTGDFTIEFWMFALSLTTTAGIVGKKTGDASNGWQVYHNQANANGKMSARLGLQNDFASASSWTLYKWDHWALTRSGTTLRWFKNGVLDAIGTSSVNLTDTATTYIGYSQTWGGAFNGYLANLRVVKGTALYTSSFTPDTAPLTAVSGTVLLTLQNATFVDNSSSAQFITAAGSAAMVNSGTALAITRNGNVSQGSFSPFGTLWSNYFDGTGDYLNAGSNPAFGFGTGAYTVEFWVYPISLSTVHIYTRNSTTGGHQVYWDTTTGLGISSVGTGAFLTCGTSALTVGQWQHVAVCRNSTATNDTRIFVNGVLKATGTDANNWTVTGPFCVGADSSGTNGFTGHMSNVRLLKGTALYAANFTPPAAPLTAVSGTSLLTCQSNSFIDNSSNNATLTRNGDVAVSRFSPFSPSAVYDTSVIGGSAYFDGAGDYLSAANAATAFGTGDFTIECWVYYTNKTNSGIFQIGATLFPAVNGIGVGLDGSTNWMLYYGNGSQTSAAQTPNVGMWHHVAAVRSSGVTKLYVNGVSIISVTDTANYTGTVPGLGSIYSTSYVMTGHISNFRVVNGTAVYTGPFTPPTAPLPAVANTTLLLQMSNGAIFDNAMMCDLETVGDAKISTSVKKFGTGSIYFDGSGDRLAAPLNQSQLAFGSGDFTVEAWVYRTVSATQVILIGQCDGATVAGSSFVCYVGSATSDLYIGGTSYAAASPNPSLNTWAHVAFVRYGATWKTYLNGVQVGSVALPAGGTVNIGTTTYPACIGGGGGGASVLTGYIDELRVTKGVARYTADFTPPIAAFSNQ